MTSVAFSMGKSKRPDLSASTKKFVPGPGNYSAKTHYTSQQFPSWGFGSGKRPNLAEPQSSKELGPGAYAITSKAIEGSRYSMGGINYKEKKYGSISPGPGAYQPKGLHVDNFSFSMGQKLEHGGAYSSAKKDKTAGPPGPGNYDPQWMFKSDGFTRFGSAKRAGIYNERNAKFVPSPDRYKQDAAPL